MFPTDEEFAQAHAIVTDADPFRVVIRGHALLEEIINRAINDAFSGGIPAELKRLNLPARLALAEALELITTEVSTAISTLAKIRNRLAHGGDDVVTNNELRRLREAFEPFSRDEIDLPAFSEVAQLQIMIATIWQVTGFTVEYAFEMRAEVDAALAAWRKRGALSFEQVKQLLESDESASGEPSK